MISFKAYRKALDEGVDSAAKKPENFVAPDGKVHTRMVPVKKDVIKKDADAHTEQSDPCWDSHKQVGMKKKGGKMVPNCVPKEQAEQDTKPHPQGSAHFYRGAMDKYKAKTPNKKESVDEALERDGPNKLKNFDRNFSKSIDAHIRGGKTRDYLSKKADQRRDMNKKNDPGADKKGLALSVIDREKARIKARKHKMKEALEFDESALDKHILKIHNSVKTDDEAHTKIMKVYGITRDHAKSLHKRVVKAKPMGLLKRESIEEAAQYRVHSTTHTGEKFKSGLMTKKAADDKHWNMTKAKDKRGKPVYKSIEVQKEDLDEALTAKQRRDIEDHQARMRAKKDAKDAAATKHIKRVNGKYGNAKLDDMDEATKFSHPAAQELWNYSQTSKAGIDKGYFQKAAGYIDQHKHSGNAGPLVRHIKDGDTDPRDHVLDTIEKHDKALHKSVMTRAGFKKIR